MKAFRGFAMVTVLFLLAQPRLSTLRAEDPPKRAEENTQTSAPMGTKARDVLEQADAAARKLKSVKYTLRAQRLDVPPERSSRLEGTAIVVGWNGETPNKFRYEVKTWPGGGGEPATVIVGYDGEQYWALNMRDKKAFTGETIESIGAYQLLVSFFPIHEFVLPAPFGDEIIANRQEYMGTATVEGELCDQVHVAYRSGAQEATWYFSVKDHLPRRVDRRLSDPAGAIVTRGSVITEVVADPELSDDTFTLIIPESFVKMDGAVP